MQTEIRKRRKKKGGSNMKKKGIIGAIFVVAVVAGAIGLVYAAGGEALDPPGPGYVEAGEPIVIGGTFTLTGPVSHGGRMIFEGTQVAVDYVNKELGGILGHEVKLKYYDDEFNEAKITMQYEKLISRDKVDLLVSPYTSIFLAAIPVVHKHKMLLFCNAADSYVGNDKYGQTVVNIQMDDKWRGGMWWHDFADWLVRFDEWNYKKLPRPKTIAVMNLNISYGHEGMRSFITSISSQGSVTGLLSSQGLKR
jgi:hypothetical protein